MRRTALLTIPLFALAIYFVANSYQREAPMPTNFPVLDVAELSAEPTPPAGATELATFGSGCFWCTEAVFQQLKGVRKVESGYSGGTVPDPSYELVCTGTSGHAEVIQVTYEPAVISYAELLEVFWRSHDPTTLNRQGHDSGTQYRSAIFTHTDRQKLLAERYKQKINEAGVYSSPVVTEITPYTAFYKATANHQNFYANNPRQGYCRVVIAPKLDKLKAAFKDKLKNE